MQILSIACGGNHNLALAKDGSVYTWGYGDMYALGHGLEKDEPKPRKLNFTKAKISNITITQVSYTSRLSFVVCFAQQKLEGASVSAIFSVWTFFT